MTLDRLSQERYIRWIEDLLDDPDLEAAEDLLEAAVPTKKYVWSCGPAETQAPANREEPKSAIWRSISNMAFYAALVAIVVGAVVFGGKAGGRTQFFGFSYYEVLTGSMESMIPRGSLVVARQVPSGQIKTGDVITFLRSDEESVTHQVIDIVPDFNGSGALGFQTKGTDNLEPDPDIVAAANVLGVVKLHVPVLGFTLRWVSDNMKYVFILFILIILISIAVRVFWGERKSERAQQSDQDCGHIKFKGGKKSPSEERNNQPCKRQKAVRPAATGCARRQLQS